MRSPSVAIICINFNREQETAGFVHELLEQKGELDLRILIVDNSTSRSGPDCLLELTVTDPRICLVGAGKNLGYFGGAAFALDEFRKRELTLPDLLVVCNTDIKFLHGDFLGKLVGYYGNGNAAVIAPTIYLSTSGIDQNPNMRHRPSNLRMHLYKWLYRSDKFLTIYEKIAHARESLSSLKQSCKSTQGALLRPVSIYAPHGSFLIFHRTYFENGGTLNHGAFLFGEEIYVAETARKLGLRVVYDPRLRIYHKGHSTTKSMSDRAKFHAQAAGYCADTFFRFNR